MTAKEIFVNYCKDIYSKAEWEAKYSEYHAVWKTQLEHQILVEKSESSLKWLNFFKAPIKWTNFDSGWVNSYYDYLLANGNSGILVEKVELSANWFCSRYPATGFDVCKGLSEGYTINNNYTLVLGSINQPDLSNILSYKDLGFYNILFFDFYKYIYLYIIIFIIGCLGIFLTRRNIIVIIMSIELILLSTNLIFIFLSINIDDLLGQIFALYILTIAAAESSIGLALIVIYYRLRGLISIDYISTIKG